MYPGTIRRRGRQGKRSPKTIKGRTERRPHKIEHTPALERKGNQTSAGIAPQIYKDISTDEEFLREMRKQGAAADARQARRSLSHPLHRQAVQKTLDATFYFPQVCRKIIVCRHLCINTTATLTKATITKEYSSENLKPLTLGDLTLSTPCAETMGHRGRTHAPLSSA